MFNEEKKIAIVIDDDYFNLEVCAATLESEGYQVYKSMNTDDTIKLLASLVDKKSRIVALVDYQLTETNGIELIDNLIGRGYTNIEYFILSASEKSEMPNVNSKNRINYLKKPLDIVILNTLLSKR